MPEMRTLAVLIGSLLIAAGLAFYLPGRESWTALIPAFAGLPILIFGIVAFAYENARKAAMHAAMSPSCVVISASEIPPDSMRGSPVPCLVMTSKVEIIPVTVPNSPRRGATAANTRMTEPKR